MMKALTNELSDGPLNADEILFASLWLLHIIVAPFTHYQGGGA
jgi:hypothetical protein